MKKKGKVIILITTILIIFYYIFFIGYTTRGIVNNIKNKIVGKTLNKSFETKIKSGNLATDYTVEQALEDIEKFNLNTINLPVVIDIETVTSNKVKVNENSLERATWLLKKLKGTNINIILEPYPWIANGSEYETNFNPNNKEDFFESWKNDALKPLIDKIAIPYHVDAVNIATSFTMLEEYEDKLCELVDFTKKYYKGLVTYRTSFWNTTNWNNEELMLQQEDLRIKYEKKLNNKIFSKVDFISIASYFELSDNEQNTVEELTQYISESNKFGRKQKIKEEVEGFYHKWQKPVFFGELGFPRTDGAAVEPWNPYRSSNINNQEQANCFEAYKNVYSAENWFLGFSIFAIGSKTEDKMYYPAKEATEVIRNFYN